MLQDNKIETNRMIQYKNKLTEKKTIANFI